MNGTKLRNRLGILGGLLILLVPQTSPGQPRQILAENFRIHPGSMTQTEPSIVVSPNNPDLIFASANTIRLSPFFVSEGVYVSTDNGSVWWGDDIINAPDSIFHYGETGIVIDKEDRFILTRVGRTPLQGIFSHVSTDRGMNWTGGVAVTGHEVFDRPTIATDTDPASPYYGRTYVSWVRFAPPYAVFVSSSDDGGMTWTPALQVNTPPQRCAGVEITVGPHGTVYLCWSAVINTSPFTEVFTGFASSTTGGTSWTVTENAYATNGIQGLLTQKANIRVNGYPRIAVDHTNGPRRGWIYVVTTERGLAPAGDDPDVILHRSTNGGATWSAGIRVNQDQVNNGKIQYFPAIHVDTSGGLNILYYDDRLTTSDSSGVFISRSANGGVTWRDFSISDHNFRPSSIGGLGQGYQGDNIGLTSTQGRLWPVWMDNSTGIYQLWTCPIELDSLVIGDSTLSFDPRVLDFGSVLVGSSATGTITIANNGAIEVLIDSVQVEDAEISFIPTGPQVLVPFGSTDYTFTFIPTAPGPQRGRIIWHTSSSSSPDTVEVSGTGAVLPTPFYLQQNRPNPVSPSHNGTSIVFGVPEVGHVQLHIFDLLGREVATLVNGTLEAGRQEFTWEVQHVSAGMYFYRLTIGGASETRKLMVLK